MKHKFIKRFFIFISLEFICVLAFFVVGKVQQSERTKILQQQQTIAQKLLLSDVCLTTESRHTRHISMPEWIAPFQDFPAYLEHFPSSSFYQHIGK
jgi:hypothetical protein